MDSIPTAVPLKAIQQASHIVVDPTIYTPELTKKGQIRQIMGTDSGPVTDLMQMRIKLMMHRNKKMKCDGHDHKPGEEHAH